MKIKQNLLKKKQNVKKREKCDEKCGDFATKVCFFCRMRSDLQKNEYMKESLETVYADFESIARSAWSSEVRRVLLNNLYDRLGGASAAFDNMVYERLGMSPEEILDMYDMDSTLPQH